MISLKIRLLPLFLLPFFAFAQDEEPVTSDSGDNRWYFGVNAGGLLANKFTAGYYTYNDKFTVYDLIAIPQVYNQIYSKTQKDFTVGELPANPRYRAGIDLGLHGGFYLDATTAIYTNINFARIRVAEAFTLEAVDPINPSGSPIILVESITGEEQRLNIDLGFHIDYGTNERYMAYFEIGGNFNSVKARKNEALIEGFRYNLLLQPNYYTRVQVGGAGFGGVLSTGVRIRFNEKVSFDIGGSAYYQKINLYEEGNKLKLNPLLYLRILYI